MRRADICLYLGPEDRAKLEAIIADRNSPRKLCWRAGSNSQCESLFTLGGPGRCRCDVLTQASMRGFARHRESDSLAGCGCFRPFLPHCADAWTGFRTSVAG